MASAWATRSTASGVLRAMRLDSNADLGPNWVPDPIRQGNWGWDNTYGRQDQPPRIDTTQSCEGSAGALMFTRSGTSFASNGQWGCRFTDGDVTTIGATESVYMQVANKHSAALWDTIALANVDTGEKQGGTKFFDLQRAGGSTSDDLKQVVVTYYDTHIPVMYNGPLSHGMYIPLNGGLDYRFQSEVPSCLYSNNASCVRFPRDDWGTLQLGMNFLGRVPTNSSFVDARVRLWLAQPGQASQLLMDWNPDTPGYFPTYWGPIANDWRYGMCYLFPYLTNLDARQVWPLAPNWYANLIISTQQIDDPPLDSSSQGTQPNPVRRSRVKVT